MSMEHLGFILGSYAAALAAIGGCVIYVLADYRAQVKKLDAMEASGLYRRSRKPDGHTEIRTGETERPDWDVS